jgi:hypothetical protein
VLEYLGELLGKNRESLYVEPEKREGTLDDFIME